MEGEGLTDGAPGSRCSAPQLTLYIAVAVVLPIAGSHGGEHVEVEGSFDNWSTRQPLQRTGRDFTVIKLLPPGVYQYKFIVDGDWKYDPNQPAMFDEIGNVNNVIEVQEYVPENLENVSGFDPPPSPPARWVVV
jgi:5'-AMP-activated protein kinase regulatory beta subunit